MTTPKALPRAAWQITLAAVAALATGCLPIVRDYSVQRPGARGVALDAQSGRPMTNAQATIHRLFSTPTGRLEIGDTDRSETVGARADGSFVIPPRIEWFTTYLEPVAVWPFPDRRGSSTPRLPPSFALVVTAPGCQTNVIFLFDDGVRHVRVGRVLLIPAPPGPR